jgi:hypothetical protein
MIIKEPTRNSSSSSCGTEKEEDVESISHFASTPVKIPKI